MDWLQTREGQETSSAPIPPLWLRVGGLWGSRLVFTAAALGVVLWVLFQLRLAVLPVLIAILISTLITPIARLFRRAKVPAALASALALLCCLAIFGGLGALIAVTVSGEVNELGSRAVEGYRQLAANIAGGLGVPSSEVDGWVDAQLSNLRSSGVATAALRQFKGVVEGLTIVVLSFVFTFLFCWDGKRQFEKLVAFLGRERRPAASDLGARIWETIGGYMRGMFIVAAVDAVLLGIGFWLIGMPLILPLMLLMFLGALVPFFGPILAAAVAALVALAEGSPTMAGLAVGVAFLVQQIEGNLLHPLIMGRAVELHPSVILFAVTAGGVLGGIVGIFLAVPIAAALATTLSFVRERRFAEGDEPESSGALAEVSRG